MAGVTMSLRLYDILELGRLAIRRSWSIPAPKSKSAFFVLIVAIVLTEILVNTRLMGLQSIGFDLQWVREVQGKVGWWCRWVPE